jgi:hypothetical protein
VEDAANRIDKMVFFDAVVPESGESFFSAINMPSPIDFNNDFKSFYAQLGFPLPKDDMLWCFPNLPADAFGVTDQDEMSWLNARQTCQPIHTFDQPVDFSWNSTVQKYFIHATVPWFSYQEFSAFKDRAIAMGWNMYTIPGSHYVAISNPDEVVRVLTLIDNIPYDTWPFE